MANISSSVELTIRVFDFVMGGRENAEVSALLDFFDVRESHIAVRRNESTLRANWKHIAHRTTLAADLSKPNTSAIILCHQRGGEERQPSHAVKLVNTWEDLLLNGIGRAEHPIDIFHAQEAVPSGLHGENRIAIAAFGK